jgi:hypothetical protein
MDMDTGMDFRTGKNHDEKPREDMRIGHDVDDEDTQPAELSDGAFSDMITSNDHRHMTCPLRLIPALKNRGAH